MVAYESGEVMAYHRPVLSRRTLLLFGTISLGMAAVVAVFEFARDPGDDAAIRFIVWIVLATLWLTAGLRAPHPYRDGSTPDPSIPVSRLPRWRRPADPLPLGAWILLPILMLAYGVSVLLVLAMLSALLGPWPVLGAAAALLGLYHWRKRHPRRRRGMASLPIGALILVPVLVVGSLVCVVWMVTAIVSLILG